MLGEGPSRPFSASEPGLRKSPHLPVSNPDLLSAIAEEDPERVHEDTGTPGNGIPPPKETRFSLGGPSKSVPKGLSVAESCPMPAKYKTGRKAKSMPIARVASGETPFEFWTKVSAHSATKYPGALIIFLSVSGCWVADVWHWYHVVVPTLRNGDARAHAPHFILSYLVTLWSFGGGLALLAGLGVRRTQVRARRAAGVFGLLVIALVLLRELYTPFHPGVVGLMAERIERLTRGKLDIPRGYGWEGVLSVSYVKLFMAMTTFMLILSPHRGPRADVWYKTGVWGATGMFVAACVHTTARTPALVEPLLGPGRGLPASVVIVGAVTAALSIVFSTLLMISWR